MQSILLITGWGVGTRPLQPLQQALIGQGFQVELINIFNILEKQSLETYTQLAEKFDIIVGWSLGGQLATILAQQIYEKIGQAKTLITLASNPCFLVSNDWPIGMHKTTFESFRTAFVDDPQTTLKRFCYLVTQGGQHAKQDWQHLQNSIDLQEHALAIMGLELLEQLNVVEILNNYVGNQFHIYASDDGLVSYKITQKMQKLSAKFVKLDSVSGSHGFPVFQVAELSRKISQYLRNK